MNFNKFNIILCILAIFYFPESLAYENSTDVDQEGNNWDLRAFIIFHYTYNVNSIETDLFFYKQINVIEDEECIFSYGYSFYGPCIKKAPSVGGFFLHNPPVYATPAEHRITFYVNATDLAVQYGMKITKETPEFQYFAIYMKPDMAKYIKPEKFYSLTFPKRDTYNKMKKYKRADPLGGILNEGLIPENVTQIQDSSSGLWELITMKEKPTIKKIPTMKKIPTEKFKKFMMNLDFHIQMIQASKYLENDPDILFD